MAGRRKKQDRRHRRRQRRNPLSPVPADVQIVEASDETALRLQAAEEGGDGERPLRRFTMTAYTGGRLQLDEFAFPVVVDLSGMRVPARSRPILRDHDAGRVVGHSTDIRINASSIQLDGVISGANDHAREIAESAENGFPWQASIGARARRMAFVDRGERVQVNGRTFVGPLYVARQSMLREVSFVTLGADDNTTARFAASASKVGVTDMDFEQWIEAKGFDGNELSDAQRATLEAAYRAEQDAGDGGGDDPEPRPSGSGGDGGTPVRAAGGDGAAAGDDHLEELRARRARELQRVHRIGEICAQYRNPTVEVDGEPVPLEAHAVQKGWSIEQTELHALRASRPQAPAVQTGGQDENLPVLLSAALCLSAGVSEEFLGKQYDERTMNAALSRRYRDVSLHYLMDESIRAAGRHYSGSRRSDDFIRAALEADRTIKAESGFTTLSLSNVLEDVANKALLASYDAQNVAWPAIAAIRSHSDFKVHNRYRLDSTGSFQKVGPDGELKHIGLSDAKYTNQLDTYGAIIALTRQMMINDDLGAFLEIPRMLGRQGAIRLEEAVFVLLLSNPSSFFSSGNGNLLTGAGSALSISSLSDAIESFRNQVDSNGKPVLVEPDVLLVPSTLATEADDLRQNTQVAVRLDSSDNREVVRNPHANRFRNVVSPYINNTAITDEDGNAISGQSDTQWYLFAEPEMRAAVGVAFLNGRRSPVIENAQTDFNTLGMQWRGYHDFGVGMEDPVAAVKSAGA